MDYTAASDCYRLCKFWIHLLFNVYSQKYAGNSSPYTAVPSWPMQGCFGIRLSVRLRSGGWGGVAPKMRGEIGCVIDDVCRYRLSNSLMTLNPWWACWEGESMLWGRTRPTSLPDGSFTSQHNFLNKQTLVTTTHIVVPTHRHIHISYTSLINRYAYAAPRT